MTVKKTGIIQSMSRKENCWGNAVAETFFHTVKIQHIYQVKFQDYAEAEVGLFS